MKMQLPVQSVSDLYQVLATNCEDAALWLVEIGPHQAGGSADVPRREQEIDRDLTLHARFDLMAHILSAA